MAERRPVPPAAGAALAVLAKAPTPGFAKTRLIPLLGAEGAAELHAMLVERTLRAARAAGFASIALWCAPGREHPFFASLAEGGALELRDQPGGDLGVRLLAAARAHLAAGPVVLVGTDCPGLGAGHLQAAAGALAAGADAAILPAEDGGYAALGLRRADASLFAGIPWGTGKVLEVTRERLRRLGWTVHEQPAVRDVDVPADVAWLASSGLLGGEERARLERYLARS
jgi:rSAM/selenodomain-associated transferase 1